MPGTVRSPSSGHWRQVSKGTLVVNDRLEFDRQPVHPKQTLFLWLLDNLDVPVAMPNSALRIHVAAYEPRSLRVDSSFTWDVGIFGLKQAVRP